MKSIIIIDSGVDLNNESICNHIVGGINIELINGEVIKNDSINDENGHGTYCIETILSVFSDVNFYIIKIVNKKGYTLPLLLYEALKCCKDIPIQTICLSLSVVSSKKYEKIETVLFELYKQRKAICVSYDNESNDSFPACCNSTIGVKREYMKNGYAYVYTSNVREAFFDGTPIFVKSINGGYIIFRGNSKANAVCAAIVSEIIERYLLSGKDINYFLIKHSLNEAEMQQQKSVKICSRIEQNELSNFIAILFAFNGTRLSKEQCVYDLPIISDITNITYDNIYKFLVYIQNLYNKKLDFKKLKVFDIYFLGNFLVFLKGLENEIYMDLEGT